MGLKATCSLLGLEDMRRELFLYCNNTSCEECLFEFCCDFNRIDEEEIEMYYALIFETDEMEKEDKAELIYEIQWLKAHCNNQTCSDCALSGIVDCSCFDNEEIIHRNFNTVMGKRKELVEYCEKHDCIFCGASDICSHNMDIVNLNISDTYIEMVKKKALKTGQNHGEDEKPDIKVKTEGKANSGNTPSVILENPEENEIVIKISSSRKIDSVTIVFAEEKGEEQNDMQK